MEQQEIQLSNFKFPPTHSFIYHGQKYPFNYGIFKLVSKTLNKMENTLSNSNEIQLISNEKEQPINLSDETITNFIQFCQMGKCIINKENVIQLNYLSQLYEVDELNTATNNFISQHEKDLQIEMLLFYQNSSNKTETIEENISSNLFDFFSEEKFFSVSVPVLHRIFTNFTEKNNSKSEEDNQKMADFLFKYLEKNGKPASVLFSFIDFSRLPSAMQRQLLVKNSDEFDFHFINPSFMKSTYEISCKMLQKIQIFESLKDEMNQKFELQNQEAGQIRTEMNQKIEQQSQEAGQIRTEMNQKFEQQSQEAGQIRTEMNQKFEQQSRDMQQLRVEIQSMREQMNKVNASIEKVYPVGSIYMSVKDTHPASLFGGRWEKWGQGRVPVGVSESGTFSSVERTGGSETHRLTTSEIPSHDGHIPDRTYAWGGSGEDTYYINTSNALKYNIIHKCNSNRPYVIRYNNELTLRSLPAGGNGSHNNLQPYITCYMWKRTG